MPMRRARAPKFGTFGILWTVLVLLALSAAPAQAQNCSLSVDNLVFGDVDVLFGSTASTATGNITVSCTGNPNFLVEACVGIGIDGVQSQPHHMTGPRGNTLDYYLYSDDSFSRILQPQDRIAFSLQLDRSGNSGSRTKPFFARIQASQNNRPVGAYSDRAQTKLTSSYISTMLAATTNTCASIVSNPILGAINATASIKPNCEVSATTMDFGTVSVIIEPLFATSSILVNCTSGALYQVGLNNGLHSDLGAPGRKMALGSSTIAYELYIDSAHVNRWNNVGSTVGTPSPNIYSGTGLATSTALTVYGLVKPQPSPSPGTYTDTIVVTVVY